MGATFDPSALYRFNAVRRALRENGLSTADIAAHAAALQARLIAGIGQTALAAAELLNPLAEGAHARFLAFRADDAQHWYSALKSRNCITDVRGDVLRIGFGPYQDETDVDRLLAHLANI